MVLYDILLRETDEEHPLSTDEIVEKLRERGINIARKVLPGDIELLNKYGFEVLSYKKRSYYYYVAYRKFDVAELRILIDAIQAANFIPEAHTIDLAKRLAGLAGTHSAEEMGRRFVCYDTVKKNNNNITLTYSDELHTEESFKKGVKICLRNLCYRNGWKYIGVWERSPEKKRLHFHGIFYIPEGTMPGRMIDVEED